MKIALVGPGILPIPPPGWGAVETIVDAYSQALTALGHEVTIINLLRQRPQDNQPTSAYSRHLIDTINAGHFELVHFHYDVHAPLIPYIQAKSVALTSHYPYIDQLSRHSADGYSPIFRQLTAPAIYTGRVPFKLFCLAEKDRLAFLAAGAPAANLKLLPNGILVEQFAFTEAPAKPERSLYLGKISPRKRQLEFVHLPDLDFVGPIEDPAFPLAAPNYLGVWTRQQVYAQLTDYANLVLLSTGEADPLVLKEALAAGLGLVCAEPPAGVTPPLPEFITVIPAERLQDLAYCHRAIIANRQVARTQRHHIRAYASAHFSMEAVALAYLEI